MRQGGGDAVKRAEPRTEGRGGWGPSSARPASGSEAILEPSKRIFSNAVTQSIYHTVHFLLEHLLACHTTFHPSVQPHKEDWGICVSYLPLPNTEPFYHLHYYLLTTFGGYNFSAFPRVFLLFPHSLQILI